MTTQTITLADGTETTLYADGTVDILCPRCDGTGHHQYNSIDGTRCYKCRGACTIGREPREDAERKAKNRMSGRKRAERKAAEKMEAALAAADAWQAAHADLYAELTKVDIRPGAERLIGSFWYSLAERAQHGGRLSEKQTTAAYAELERQRERAAENARATAAGHIGEVGGKVTITAEVTSVKFIAGTYPYGNSLLVIMRTEAGQAAKTFTAACSEFAQQADTGVTLTLTATVKAHDEYNGVPQTVLTRCKIVK